MLKMISLLFLLSTMLVAVLSACTDDTMPLTTLTPTSTPQATQTVISPTDSPVEPVIGLRVGDIAPDFETVLDDGTTVTLADYRGQMVLLNFWATWCAPCRIEMPEFQAQYEAHRDAGFVILAVNYQETLEKIEGFRDEFGLTFPLLMDETGHINERFAIFSYPTTFLLDRDGIILVRHFGALTKTQIDALIADAL